VRLFSAVEPLPIVEYFAARTNFVIRTEELVAQGELINIAVGQRNVPILVHRLLAKASEQSCQVRTSAGGGSALRHIELGEVGNECHCRYAGALHFPSLKNAAKSSPLL
jgi:hypothetical protein